MHIQTGLQPSLVTAAITLDSNRGETVVRASLSAPLGSGASQEGLWGDGGVMVVMEGEGSQGGEGGRQGVAGPDLQ